MAVKIEPGHQLVVTGLAIATVLTIFSLDAPALHDVRHDEPGNMNTYKSVNTATITSTAVVVGLALLTKSPTVFIGGGALILVEAWKHHFANFGVCGDRQT